MLKKISCFIVLVQISFLASLDAEASKGAENLAQIRTLLRKISQRASILEGENAAFAESLEDFFQGTDKKEALEKDAFEKFSDPMRAELAGSGLLNQRSLVEIRTKKARKRISLIERSYYEDGELHELGPHSVIDPENDVINRYRRRELFWSTFRLLCDQLEDMIQFNRDRYESNESARSTILAAILTHFVDGLGYSRHFDLKVGILKHQLLVKADAPAKIVELPGFSPLEVKKLEAFLVLSSDRPGAVKDEETKDATNLKKVLGNPRVVETLSSTSAFGHPALKPYWDTLVAAYETAVEVQEVFESLEENGPLMALGKFDKVFFEIAAQGADGSLIETRHLNRFKARFAQQLHKQYGALTDMLFGKKMTKLFQNVRAINATESVSKPSESSESRIPGDGVEVATASEVSSEATSGLKDLKLSSTDEAVGKPRDEEVLGAAGSEAAPFIATPSTEPKAAPEAKSSQLVTHAHSKRFNLTKNAAQLFYATGIGERIKGYATPTFTRSDFEELLKQLGTRESIQGLGGSAHLFELPDLHNTLQSLTPHHRTFRIHLPHSGRDELPLETIRRFLGSALKSAGLTDEVVGISLPG